MAGKWHEARWRRFDGLRRVRSLLVVTKARLDGHPFDLDSLSRSFRDGDPHVNKDQEGYYLGASALDDLINDGGQLYATATTLLRQMNGVARALDCDYRPVQLVGRFSDGERTHHVAFVVDVAEARDLVTAAVARVDGMDARQPLAPGPRYLGLVDDHPDVADVLAILGKPVRSLEWFDLYKAYEIIRSNVGNEEDLIAKGWETKQDIKAFTASANRPDMSGDSARHARQPPKRPKHNISLSEGQDMIRRLAIAWMGSL